MLLLLLLHVSEATTKVVWSNFFLPLGCVRTDATTPIIVAPKMLGVVELRACWQWCANGCNIVALRFGDHGTKEVLGVVG